MKTIITILLFICSSIFIHAQQTEKNYPTKIPTFRFEKIKNEGEFKTSDIKKDKKTLIAILSPNCIHCLISMEHLNANSNLLKDINTIFVTEYEKDEFLSKFNSIAPQLKELATVEVLQDTRYEFFDLFNPTTLPTFYLYDKEGKLETVKKGSVEVNELFNYLK